MRHFIFRSSLAALARLGLAVAPLAFALGAVPAAAQQIPQSLREIQPDDVQVQRKNGWTVRIAAGTKDDSSMRFADELGRALNDGDDLRVLPVASRGPAGNVEDLFYLQDIDIAVTQADVLEYFRTERKTPLNGRVQYITRLPPSELHVGAREDIHTMEDLRGQKVVFGPPGSAPAVTGPMVFRRLGIAVKPVFVDLREGLRMVRAGEASALLTVDSKPSDFWLRVPPYAGLHFVPAPHGKAVADLYDSAEFTSADYPNLIGPGERIDTLSVAGVLAVQNLPKSDDRFRRVLRFVQYLSARWDRLREKPYHPGWRDLSLAASVPGWTRFSAAEVFRQFILWRDQQYSHRAP
jgi:TRAP-type uncharacterized transport system substrate-binding protein